jgi:hypothetical protein
VEKCEKLWQPGGELVGLHGEACSISRAGATFKMRACSACAGDYEDPDRTASAPDDADDAEDAGCDDARSATTEEFPAEE